MAAAVRRNVEGCKKSRNRLKQDCNWLSESVGSRFQGLRRLVPKFFLETLGCVISKWDPAEDSPQLRRGGAGQTLMAKMAQNGLKMAWDDFFWPPQVP